MEQRKDNGKRRTEERSKANAKGEVDAMERGHGVCLCDMRYNKGPGGERDTRWEDSSGVTNTCTSGPSKD